MVSSHKGDTERLSQALKICRQSNGSVMLDAMGGILLPALGAVYCLYLYTLWPNNLVTFADISVCECTL